MRSFIDAETRARPWDLESSGHLSAPITAIPLRIAKGGLSTDSYFFLIGG